MTHINYSFTYAIRFLENRHQRVFEKVGKMATHNVHEKAYKKSAKFIEYNISGQYTAVPTNNKLTCDTYTSGQHAGSSLLEVETTNTAHAVSIECEDV